MNKAFTLIEVLVASLILSMFAAAFPLMVFSSIKAVNTSGELTVSIFSAKSMIEELRGKPFGSLPSYNNVSFDKGKGLIVVRSSGNDTVAVTVKHRKVELNTLRSRY